MSFNVNPPEGSTPPLSIRSFDDIKQHRIHIDYELKKKVKEIDALIESDPNGNAFNEHEFEDAFEKQESEVKSSIESFEERSKQTSIDEELSEEKKLELKKELLEVQTLGSELRDIMHKKLVKKRALLLTKYFWNQVKQIKEKKAFPSRTKRNLRLFQEAMRSIDNALSSMLKSSPQFDKVIEKGKMLEIKEDLLLSYVEYKQNLSTSLTVDKLAKPKEFIEHHIATRAQYRRLLANEKESQDIHVVAETMIFEGEEITKRMAMIKSRDKRALEHNYKMAQRGRTLTRIGFELREKTTLIIHEIQALKKELNIESKDPSNVVEEIQKDPHLGELFVGIASGSGALTNNRTTYFTRISNLCSLMYIDIAPHREKKHD